MKRVVKQLDSAQPKTGYAEAKNLKHLKDAQGHLMHFDRSKLSEFDRSLVDVVCYNLRDAIHRICGK